MKLYNKTFIKKNMQIAKNDLGNLHIIFLIDEIFHQVRRSLKIYIKIIKYHFCKEGEQWEGTTQFF